MYVLSKESFNNLLQKIASHIHDIIATVFFNIVLPNIPLVHTSISRGLASILGKTSG